MQVVDPVCKMTIEDKDAVGTSTYKGTTYYFCSMPCKEDFEKNPESYLMPAPILMTDFSKAEMAKDPICGMVIPKDRSIKRVVGGREYYFCSETCVRTFEAPEAELKDMKRRVTIALTGVLALAVFRAALFLGLAAGRTVLTWVPFSFLPWFTAGVWLLITPP